MLAASSKLNVPAMLTAKQRVAVFLARGQMNDRIAARDQIFDQVGVGNASCDFCHALDVDRIAVAQRQHLVAGREQRPTQRNAQLSAGASDQDFLNCGETSLSLRWGLL